jgi:nitrite reductase/ring-hydroxylating ferredoxin subunit
MTLYKLNLNRKALKEDQPTGTEVQGKRMAIVLHKGNIYALNAVCTHMGGPLDKGKVKGEELVCPWHLGAYFMATGKADENTKWVHDTQTYKIVEDASGELSAEM